MRYLHFSAKYIYKIARNNYNDDKVIFMKHKLVHDINNYISYLTEQNLFITIHGWEIGGLLENNIHRNPFCSLVKTDDAAWQKCIHCQQKVFREYKKGVLFGMCHAGLEEYVFFVNSKLFVSVSGYGIHKAKATERIRRLSQEYYLDKSELLRIYENNLKHVPEDTAWLSTVIWPLCHMLELLQLLHADIAYRNTQNEVFDSILSFVQRNFMHDITICHIAQACACSESSVCHLFKQYTGTSVKKYIQDLRITQAQKLLKTSDLPINTIAQLCGFSNINYFPTAFKKRVGVPPTDYRKASEDS